VKESGESIEQHSDTEAACREVLNREDQLDNVADAAGPAPSVGGLVSVPSEGKAEVNQESSSSEDDRSSKRESPTARKERYQKITEDRVLFGLDEHNREYQDECQKRVETPIKIVASSFAASSRNLGAGEASASFDDYYSIIAVHFFKKIIETKNENYQNNPYPDAYLKRLFINRAKTEYRRVNGVEPDGLKRAHQKQFRNEEGYNQYRNTPSLESSGFTSISLLGKLYLEAHKSLLDKLGEPYKIELIYEWVQQNQTDALRDMLEALGERTAAGENLRPHERYYWAYLYRTLFDFPTADVEKAIGCGNNQLSNNLSKANAKVEKKACQIAKNDYKKQWDEAAQQLVEGSFDDPWEEDIWSEFKVLIKKAEGEYS
jgi:hypothetical protein